MGGNLWFQERLLPHHLLYLSLSLPPSACVLWLGIGASQGNARYEVTFVLHLLLFNISITYLIYCSFRHLSSFLEFWRPIDKTSYIILWEIFICAIFFPYLLLFVSTLDNGIANKVLSCENSTSLSHIDLGREVVQSLIQADKILLAGFRVRIRPSGP